MGRHVRGRRASRAAAAGAVIGPPPLLGAGRSRADLPWLTADADRPAAAVARVGRPRPGSGASPASNPGAATVTMPDGTSFRTEPGRQYAVPVGSRMTLPSRITMRLDRPGPVLNIEDRSQVHVIAPDDVPAA